MSQQSTPDLKQYMDKKLSIKLNGKRSVTGVLRGFDQFMNLVLDAAIEETGSQSNKIGTIVRFLFSLLLFSLKIDDHPITFYLSKFISIRFRRLLFSFADAHKKRRCDGDRKKQVIRGNSIVRMECLDRL